MQAEQFRKTLLEAIVSSISHLQTSDKEWILKGFIDLHRNVYSLSIDTKVISKLLELMLFPIISRFAKQNELEMILAEYQNHYPDISFIDDDHNKFAVDIKTTYRTGGGQVNGFTLGAFTGYFRNRKSLKNITFPYEEYKKHYVLGIIYSKQTEKIDERCIYQLSELDRILSVITDIDVLLHEKYCLAGSRPGSGNTKNIGSITDIEKLKRGQGPFAELGEACFDDYWMYYLTRDMAPEGIVPYGNLRDYFDYKKRIPSVKNPERLDNE